MFQEDPDSFQSSANQPRRKGLPLVPKFDSFGSFPSSGSMGFSTAQSSEESPKGNTAFFVKEKNDNQIEEEIKPFGAGEQRSPVGSSKNEHKDDVAQKGKSGPPTKMPAAFMPNIDLGFINKLYAEKDLANKNAATAAKEKKETKKPVNTPVEEAASYQLQKARDEYDPARPNDYEMVLEERAKKRVQEEEKKRKEQDKIQEEESFIPFEDDRPNFSKYPTMEEEPPIEEEEISGEEKAMKMLEKQGWKMGEGLGKNKQGMTTPLIMKKTSGNTAVIANSALDITAALPPELVAKKAREAIYNIPPTRIIILLNMISAQDIIDEQLREEIVEEAQNYGKVLDCEICEINNVSEEERFRVFVEYDRKESAISAFSNMYGRFFAGRTIIVKFYDEKAYEAKNFYLPL